MSKTEMTPEERDAKEQEEFNTGPLRYRTGGFGSMGRKRCCFEAAVWLPYCSSRKSLIVGVAEATFYKKTIFCGLGCGELKFTQRRDKIAF